MWPRIRQVLFDLHSSVTETGWIVTVNLLFFQKMIVCLSRSCVGGGGGISPLTQGAMPVVSKIPIKIGKIGSPSNSRKVHDLLVVYLANNDAIQFHLYEHNRSSN